MSCENNSFVHERNVIERGNEMIGILDFQVASGMEHVAHFRMELSD